MIKEITFPPLPVEKSFQICLAGDTTNEGVLSSENGESPLKLLPARFNWTKSPITSSTRAVLNIVSMVLFEINLKFFSKLKIKSNMYSIFIEY